MAEPVNGYLDRMRFLSGSHLESADCRAAPGEGGPGDDCPEACHSALVT